MDESGTDTVKWTVSLPRSVDVAVRLQLAQSGLRKGDLSKFVVEAVQARLTVRNIEAARARNAAMAPDDIHQAIARALSAVRAETFGARR